MRNCDFIFHMIYRSPISVFLVGIENLEAVKISILSPINFFIGCEERTLARNNFLRVLNQKNGGQANRIPNPTVSSWQKYMETHYIDE